MLMIEPPKDSKKKAPSSMLSTQLENFARCILELHNKVEELEKLLIPVRKPWFTSIGIWFAIILTLAMLYMIFLLYMKETGHHVRIGSWYF